MTGTYSSQGPAWPGKRWPTGCDGSASPLSSWSGHRRHAAAAKQSTSAGRRSKWPVGRESWKRPGRPHTATRGMSYVNSTGKRLASVDAAFGVIDAQDVEIVRGDLVDILYEAARNDVEYIFDDSISGLTDAVDGVSVTFSRRRHATFHLVVGADGLHSRVRGLAFGPESRFIDHLGLYLSVFTVPNDLGLDHWQLIAKPGRSVTVSSARGNPRGPGDLLLRLRPARL